MISMFSLCNTKEFTKILSEDGETLDGFLDYFTQHAMPTYAMLDSLRRLDRALKRQKETILVHVAAARSIKIAA
jgi:hypothetical protein